LSHSTSSVLWVFSKYGLRNYCPGWLWTMIFLISAFWVARITGMSHWCLATCGSHTQDFSAHWVDVEGHSFCRSSLGLLLGPNFFKKIYWDIIHTW
jgi:hypothetical protein